MKDFRYVIVFMAIFLVVITVSRLAVDEIMKPSRADCIHAGNVWLDGQDDYCVQLPKGMR